MIELLRSRRSCRRFTKEPVDPASLDLLIEALLRSPSSRSINPWRFVVVDDRELLAKLAAAKEHGSAFLRGAAVAIVVCADSTKSDVWVEDCSIAAILLQMTAESLGLGSCWVQIRNRDHQNVMTAEAYLQGVLRLPPEVVVEAIVGIGHPVEKRQPLPKEKLQYRKVRHNTYGVNWKGEASEETGN